MKISEYKRTMVTIESMEDFEKNLPFLLESQKNGPIYFIKGSKKVGFERMDFTKEDSIEYIRFRIEWYGPVKFIIHEETIESEV